MAHRCPTCRSRCHCLGDIDDMMVDDAPEESTCICCPDPEEEEYDDGLDALEDGGPRETDDVVCDVCGMPLTGEDNQVNDGICRQCREAPVVDEGAACRICGCTDDNACDGGCWWVDTSPLCSTCAQAIAAGKVKDPLATGTDQCACGYATEQCKMGISTDCPHTSNP